MPTVAIIDGIRIEMRPKGKEHNPPHIHAIYGDFRAMFEIKTGQHIWGLFPPKQTKIVSAYVASHSKELSSLWDTQIFK